jgi:glycosyltransferase involved in cell wall biosynthesis
MIDFTVVIPTFNGAARLPGLLSRLQTQQVVGGLTWQIIVVDNGSSDATAEVVRDAQCAGPTSVSLRYAFEPKRGAAFARQCGVEAAGSAWVGFLDDDNVPQNDWVKSAWTFAQSHPNAGAFGSEIEGEFDTPLPGGFGDVAPLLALVKRGSTPSIYDARRRVLPPAAGLAIRRTAWLECVPRRLVLNYSGADSLLASEDIEAVLHIQLQGWEIWHNPDMRIVHRIPAHRLQLPYLAALSRRVGRSSARLRMMRIAPWLRPAALAAHFAKDGYMLLSNMVRYGWRNRDSIPAICERQMLIGKLSSPFVLWALGHTHASSMDHR